MRVRTAVCLGVTSALLGASLGVANAAAPSRQDPPAPQAKTVEPCTKGQKSVFGTKEKRKVSVEGKIYFLPEDTEALPDFAKLKSEGTIYASEWDIPLRDFTEGFPGVTNRFEWFAIDYQGPFYVPKSGDYNFYLGSDDGAIFSIDGKPVVDVNGVHPWQTGDTTVTLKEGDHTLRLSYFQGPATEIGLQLFVTPPGADQKLFRLQDFNRAALQNRSVLGVKESEAEILVQFGAEVLFDTGKYDLKPAATTALQQLADLIGSYDGYPIVIEGHTDSVGTPESNQTLSENRASAVKRWLLESGGVPDGCVTTRGFGQTRPVATNDTADGRQKNRRVEVRLLKPTSEKEK